MNDSEVTVEERLRAADTLMRLEGYVGPVAAKREKIGEGVVIIKEKAKVRGK